MARIDQILSDQLPMVVFSSKSWLTDKGLYRTRGKNFTSSENSDMTPGEIRDYVKSMKRIVADKLKASRLIVRWNYYKRLFDQSALYDSPPGRDLFGRPVQGIDGNGLQLTVNPVEKGMFRCSHSSTSHD